MSLPERWAERLRLPLICAPMFHITTPSLVAAARRAGILGALPRANASSFEAFDRWLAQIAEDDAIDAASSPPMAVNLSTRLPPDEMERHLKLCRQRGVELIISATGDPTALIERCRHHGLTVFSDAINLRFARKAIAAGAQGVIAIGSGGGGHSGTINHLTLVSSIRREFDGTVVMAGAVSDGFTVRAAEVLGADLAYMGTRFIATQESGAPPEYKDMLVRSGLEDLIYTPAINGVHANWLKPSMRLLGLDPEHLPPRVEGSHGYAHLPEHVRPWANLWSAGQGIELITAVEPIAHVVDSIEREYLQACDTPRFGCARSA